MPPDASLPPALPPDPPPHAAPAPTAPEGALRYFWFDGILEGARPGDEGALAEPLRLLRGSRFGQGDVSIDGGRNWRRARLDGPSLTKALHRFYLDIDWDGSELLLQSRAIDEAGMVQPTKDELRAARGENSIYHNNGIQTWYVKADGVVENVEVS